MDVSTARVKLKDSCDSCARAKVKCGREHPTCRRCLRNALVCYYSAARRGRAAERAEAYALTQGSRPGHEIHHSHHILSSETCTAASSSSIDDLMYAEFGLSADFTRPPPLPTASATDSDGVLPGNDVMLVAAPTSALDPFLLHTMRDKTAKTVETLGTDTVRPRRDSNLSGKTCTPSSSSSSPFLSSVKDDNMRILLETLQALHMSYGDATPPPGIDTILMANAAATSNVASLLPGSNSGGSSGSGSDCGGSSSSNAQQTILETMLALVCCNSIVDAYGRIVDGGDRGGAGSGASAGIGSTRAGRPGHDIPVAVGNFTLDGVAKHTVISGLVLRELMRLGHIVERMPVAVDRDDGDGNGDINEIMAQGDRTSNTACGFAGNIAGKVPNVEVNDVNVGFDMDTDMQSDNVDMDVSSPLAAVRTLKSLVKRKQHAITQAVKARLDNVDI